MRVRQELAEGERWYVVQTQPQKEALAVANLDRQGFRTYLPHLIKTVRHARKRRIVKAPLFPRYLFVPLDMQRDQWRCINGSCGVISLVMDGVRPRPAPHGVIEELIAITAPTGEVDWGHRLGPGAPVRVLAGPFADLLGELKSLDDRGRARVLLRIMGGERVVTLPSRGLTVAA